MRSAAFVANPLICESKNFDQGFTKFESLNWQDGEKVVNAFGNWLDEVKNGRFFAYLHFMDPHGPYSPPDEYISRFSDPKDKMRIPANDLKNLRNLLGTKKKTPNDKDKLIAKNAMDRYDSEIVYWDKQFGRLLKMVEDNGLNDNTIIVVTSDHGEEFLEHGILGHGWTLFDISLHVPLIIRGPNIAPDRIEEQVELVSLAPTLVEAAGLDSDKTQFDGPSLLAGKINKNSPAYVHTEHAFNEGLHRKSSLYALRTKKWKLIYDPRISTLRLYDLEKDPKEINDLGSDPKYSDVCKNLSKSLKIWIKKNEALSPTIRFKMDEETRKAFEQLGYLGNL